jgi:hypothetical protein
VVCVVALWAAGPFWRSTVSVFGGILVSDGAQGPWFYDFVSRALSSGIGLERLWDFNHPDPYFRQDEIPGVMDAILAAPAAWIFDWPRQYGVAQGFAILLNGLGFAWLARAVGCRGAGIALAGCLGVFCNPALKELHLARVNAAWPGVVGAALACWLEILRPPTEEKTRLLLRRIPWVFAAGILGAIAASIYPPFLLMLVPAGLILAGSAFRRKHWPLLLMAVAAMGIALALIWPELAGIADSPRVSKPDCTLGTCPTEVQPGGTVRALIPLSCALIGFCPDGTLSLPLANWFTLGSPRPTVRMEAVVSLGCWILALASLLHPRRRVSSAGLLAVAGVLALLALGPCPQWNEARPLDVSGWPLGAYWLPRIWCETAVLHDYGRFATMAVLLLGALSGLGIEALGERWGRRGSRVGAVLGIAAVLQAGLYMRSELQLPQRWMGVPHLPTTEFLEAAEVGPVAELPFDSGLQFLSVMEVPKHPRVNPFNAVDQAPGSDPFLSWLYSLGRGEITAPYPLPEHARRSGVRWVLFDPTRCRAPYFSSKRACEASIGEALAEVLGSGQDLGSGVLAWDVNNAP